MTKLVSSLLAAAVVALFLSPIGFFGDTGTGPSELIAAGPPIPARLSAEITFPETIDTSVPVPEYTTVSRALMLNGGSSDVVMEDLNEDGLSDLVVSVYESLTISIFYRQADGTFKTYPSLNLTTLYHPLMIRVVDLNLDGGRHIVSLERNPAFSDTHVVMYELTSETTYERWLDKSVWGNGVAFVLGEFSGDVYLDLAVVCEALDPVTNPGRLEVRFGPTFSTFELLNTGLGRGSITAADLDDDGEDEIAVANCYDNSVMLFDRPFMNGGTPLAMLEVDGMPTSLLAGQLNDDTLTDLVVATEADPALRFFFQSSGSLPVVEDMNISLAHAPSGLAIGTMNDDMAEDILVLSGSGNVSMGFFQEPLSPHWSEGPAFVIPCGGMPRSAAVGHMDSDLSEDIAIASARSDWTGSTLALYPSRLPVFSNSNATAWTRGTAEASSITCGDLNGDDIEDLVLANPSDQSLDYAFSFGSVSGTIPLGHSPERLLVRDFDGDGAADVLVTMSDAPLVSLIRGGSGFPGDALQMSFSGAVTDAEMGDFNHDSLMDFVVSTYDGKLVFYFNDGTESMFQAPYEIFPSGSGIRSIAVGDFNSDGMDDVAFPRSILTISVLLQDAEIPFGPSSPSLTLTYPSGEDFTSLWSGDLTGDDKTDIAAMRPADKSMYIFDQNDFTTSRTSSRSLTLPEEPVFLSVADATDDGPVDVLAVFASADAVFLYRQSSGALPESPSMVFVTGAWPSSAVIGDGTGDHRGDLLVNNRGSHSVSIWQQINFPPVAFSGGPYCAREGTPLQLNGSAETGTSEIPYMEYWWDFGDGTDSTGWVRQSAPTHTYIAVGNYSIAMGVRDPTGLESWDSTYAEVLDSYPRVAFSWDPELVNEGELVTFTDETTSFDPIADKSWYVNGQPYGNGTTVAVSFQNGTQEISLFATDSDGTLGSLTRWIEVGALAPVLRIVAPAEADEGTPVEFVVMVDEWHGGPVDPITSYEWDFSYVEGSFVPDPLAPNNYSASHVFSTTSYWKIYRVAVRVTDADGMASTQTWDIRIFDSEPAAGLTINTTDPCEGIPFVFISTSTSYDGIVNWTWRLQYPNGSEERFWLDDRAMAEREFDSLDDGDYIMRLTVREADGNTSYYDLDFHVREIPPVISLTAEPTGTDDRFEEFSQVNFTCDVEGFDQGMLWEWDFDSPGPGFVADLSTEFGLASHVYMQIGEYTAKVRVTDSDGSAAEEQVILDVVQKPFGCEMYLDIRVIRVAPDTENVTFNATNLLLKYPDIVSLTYEFGDGTVEFYDGPEFPDVRHDYALGRDYLVNVTVVDDDGFVTVSRGTIFVDPPRIDMLSPFNGAVVRSGTTLLFLVTPGSTPLSIVVYDVNNEGFRPFETQYLINTTGWPDADYAIAVIAWDLGGNVAILRYVNISIDDYPPVAIVYTEKTRVYVGSTFSITVWVADRNVDASGVTLHIMFPGDRAFMAYPVTEGYLGNYYREFDVPATEGTILFFVRVTDMAGNSMVSDSYSLEVRTPFLTVAWPYMLAASLIAAVGVSGYLVRERRIAVDETFVIHNDGRMISHSTRRLKPGMDDQVLSSMFTAIQDFVRDSFKDITSFTLRKIEFGEKSVLIEKGRNVYLAVILHGHASRKVALKMQWTLDEIESKFDAHLKDWDGDLEKLRGINDITKRIYSKAPILPKRSKG